MINFNINVSSLINNFNFYSTIGTGKKRGRPSKVEISKMATVASIPSNANANVTSISVADTISALPTTVEVYVNEKIVQVPVGSVIIQACAAAGIDIPRFCYHERLAIAGNCRMCLVQVEKMPKLIASCSQPVAAGMRILTDSAQVKKAREGVMEFLLANHPLDCAICDQGGECDLQDQAMAFGSDHSRFNLETEHKRAVEDKDFGPLIKTSMNRCIHCTRCVRFGNEIAGLSELGTTGRGNDMQIGTYVQSMLGSELSANIIDLCPVGALTSKPYAFAARPWELRKTESIDVMDAVGSAIRVDTRGVDLMRIQPRTNDSVNEEWLSDKSRFVSDGLKVQRLTKPALDGKEVTWSAALETAANMIRESKDQVAVVAGPFADAETLVCARDLMANQGALSNLFIAPSLYDHVDTDDLNVELPCDHVSQFRSGLTLAQMETIDTLLVIGTNFRHDAPLMNARLRKAFLKRDKFSAGVIGCSPETDLNFDFDWLGGDLTALKGVQTSPFWEILCKSERPAIFVSESLISEHPDASDILENVRLLAHQLSKINPHFITLEWNGLSWIPRSASHVASRLIGYSRVATKTSLAPFKALLLIGSPDTITISSNDSQNLIYLGHHADRLVPISDVIFPTCAYTEKSATFINLEGRVQKTLAALDAPGEARPDWSILRALSEFINPKSPIPYDTLDELRIKRFPQICPELTEIDTILSSNSEISKLILSAPIINTNITNNNNTNITNTNNNNYNVPFKTVNIPDFYLTDVISRSSVTMAKCSLAFTEKVCDSSRAIDEFMDELMN